MKKAVLEVLMVTMFATPCLAQEIEPDGIFSFEGTRWSSCGIEIGFSKNVTPTPYIFDVKCSNLSSAYYDGRVYLCDEEDICSLCGSCEYPKPVKISHDIELDEFPRNWSFHLGREIMQPVGIGYYEGVLAYRIEAEEKFYFSYIYAVYFKVEDGWEPPENIIIDIGLGNPPDPRIIGGIWIPYIPDEIYDDSIE